MKVSLRDAAAAIIAAVTLAASFFAATAGGVDPGIHLAYADGQVVIASVDYGSSAQQDGLRAGDVVVSLDGQDTLTATTGNKQSIAEGPWRWTYLSVVDGAFLAAAGAQGQSEARISGQNYWYQGGVGRGLEPIVFGLAILLLGWWWLGTDRGGAALRPYAITLPVATAMPLLVLPMDRYPVLAASILASVLVAAAMVPMALDLVDSLEDRVTRRFVIAAVLALALVTAALGYLVPMRYVIGALGGTYGFAILRAALAGCIVFLPGIIAARPVSWRSTEVASAAQPRRFVESTELALVAMTPGVACLSLLPTFGYELWPIVVWLAAILVARVFTLRPLARLATRATHQRDLVVAATESERARIATDIHDYALQDLTMLVRRLDAAGDTANAEAAREVAERLRVICGDLRLPVLDDLGVGPALEWLCDRFEATVGKIALDRLADERRLPADVELAFFRVAQEAIANAARHGAPPVLARYRGGGNWAELEVDDAGAGLAPGAAALAEQTGHLGLLNMAQRAEAIGAELTIGRRPGGGTRVRLIWERAVGELHTVSADGAAAGRAVESASAAGLAAERP